MLQTLMDGRCLTKRVVTLINTHFHLQAIDAAFLQLTVGKTLQRSASVHLLFAFEYVIQVTPSPP